MKQKLKQNTIDTLQDLKTALNDTKVLSRLDTFEFTIALDDAFGLLKDTQAKTKPNKQMTKEQAIIRSSAHYLCDPIPEEFFDWDHNKQNLFLEDNAWEPFSSCDGDELYQHIDNLALDVIKIANKDMANITISTQDQHYIEEQKSLLKGAVGLIEDLSVGLDNADLEDDVAEFLEQYRTLTHPMR